MSQSKSVRGFCERWKIFIKIPPRPKFDEESDSDVIFEVTLRGGPVTIGW